MAYQDNTTPTDREKDAIDHARKMRSDGRAEWAIANEIAALFHLPNAIARKVTIKSREKTEVKA